MKLISVLFLVACGSAPEPQAKAPEGDKLEKQASEQAADLVSAAYISGFAGVEITRTRVSGVNTVKAGPEKAPINQFSHRDRLVSSKDRFVVTPNNDTVYSIAFLNVMEEPLVLHLPEFGERYYVVPFLSAYHEHFASIGQRKVAADGEQLITAPEGGDFLISGPDWTGQVPEGMREIKSPTNDMWVIMRPLVDGDDDLPALMALKTQTTLTPLSKWGDADWTPPDGTVLPLDPAVEKLGTPLADRRYFEALDDTVRRNPIGQIEPKLKSALEALPDPLTDADISAGAEKAIKAIQAETTTLGKLVDGWMLPIGGQGLYHGDDLRRAAYAYLGLGVINSEEAVYPLAKVDGNGDLLTGANQYTLTFAADSMPPADAFWSLSMYGTDMFFVDNPINRYSLGNRSGLKTNDDGSITLHLQKDDPGGESTANWLPAPEGGFYVVLRLYLPQSSVLTGEWTIPAIVKQ